MKNILTPSTSPFLLAPCGLSCRLCHAYVREKTVCPGCRAPDAGKAVSCLACKIKNCEKLAQGRFTFCFECDSFPCARVKHLDKRYRTRYATSPIANLLHIKEKGLQSFIELDNRRWTCPECGNMLCMHKPQCLACGYVWQKRSCGDGCFDKVAFCTLGSLYFLPEK